MAEAQQKMGSGFEKEFLPNAENAKKYQRIYKRYSQLCDFVEHKFTVE
jgi:L-ribulokinase